MTPRALGLLAALFAAAPAAARPPRNFRPIAVAGSTARARPKPRPPPTTPIPDFPRRWPLPEGWHAGERPLGDGAKVEYLSGGDPALFARVYSWPATRAFGGAEAARDKLLPTFEVKAKTGGEVRRDGELHLDVWGWTTPDEKYPDMGYVCRTTQLGGRLLGAVVGVRRPPKDDPQAVTKARALLARARELIAALSWEEPRASAETFGGGLGRPAARAGTGSASLTFGGAPRRAALTYGGAPSARALTYGGGAAVAF